ncbi:aquaporin [Mycoplasmopsis hyopharyngis]|uniref:aquaporin n=1 Tax=Mycoplasmopsis hyopharyngis TaxID=29558 RepID=UPI003872E33B
MFKFFKIKSIDRLNANEPQNKKAWAKHLASEFIGTIWISLALAGLSILIAGKPLEKFFLLHNVIVGFFAGFVVVGSCLMIFARWSVDLNPAVTLYRWLNATNTSKYAFTKILMQIAGAIVTGILIWVIGYFANGKDASNLAISSIVAAEKDFLEFNNLKNSKPIVAISSGTAWIFFGEMVMTAILLFPIFSPRIEDKYRDLLIYFIISLSVWMGILQGSAAINPARGFAQQIPDLFFGIKNQSTSMSSLNGTSWANDKKIAQYDLISATLAMVLGDLCAPFFYAVVQGLTEKYFNNWNNNIINYKNKKMQDYIK